MKYFVTAIHTDSGKTLVSAILTEALQADYWKPIQAGFPRDAETVKNLLSNSISHIHPEAYLLKTPIAPHEAAKQERITISLNKINLPPTSNNNLIIEGAGGLLVPLNKGEFMADLIPKLHCQIILVINIYLGSINHSLLTLQEIKRRNLPIKGIIFNNVDDTSHTEDIILHHYPHPCLLKIRKELSINKTIVKKYAQELLKNF